MRKYTIEYDSEADAAYVRLLNEAEAEIKETVELDAGIQADLDKEGRVVGIEILNFSKKKIALNELIAKGIENIQVAK